MKTLYPYQKKRLPWLLKRSRAALFWKMRLGKTVMSSRWAQARSGPVLIVAPLFALLSWEEHLRDEGVPFSNLRDWDTGPDLVGTNWFLVNYEALRTTRMEWVFTRKWGTVILDESTFIRSPDSQLSKLVVGGRFTRKVRGSDPPAEEQITSSGLDADAKMLLTGTPDPESPLDLFQQMKWLSRSGRFMGHDNFWGWRAEYFRPDLFGFNWEPKPGTLEAIRQAMAPLTSTLRRQDVNIGSKIECRRRVLEMPARIRKAYRKLVDEFILGDQTTQWAMQKAMWMHRLAGGCPVEPFEEFSHRAKLDQLVYDLKGEFKDEPVVVWFRFTEELRQAGQAIRDAGISVSGITGATAQADRRMALDQWGDNFNVLLVQAKCAQFGLDFSRADTAIYFSRYYDGLVNEQTRERIIHPAQKHLKLVLDYVVRDSIDEDVLEASTRKRMRSSVFLNHLLQKLRKGRT